MSITSQQLIQDRIEELRENTDFVDALLESLIGYAIIAADFDGNVIAFNEGAREIYGYAPEEIIGKQDIEIFFPEEFIETGKLQEIINDLIEKERYSYEGEKVRKNGESFPAQILFTLTKDKNGKTVGFIEIVADLTERRRAEEALKESEAKFKPIVENIRDVVFQLSPLGIIQYVSPKVQEVYGYKPEDLVGKHFKRTTPVSELVKALDALKSVLSGKVISNLEINQLDSKGKIIPMEINIAPVRREGKIIAV